MKSSYKYKIFSIGIALGAVLVLPGEAGAGHLRTSKAVLKAVEGKYYKGPFEIETPIGSCKGTLEVYFFPARKEASVGNQWSVSYRHHVLTLEDENNPVCQGVRQFSPLREEDLFGNQCNFDKQNSPIDGNAPVPFRTVIPKNGSPEATISAPLCLFGQTIRPSVEVSRLELSADGKDLAVEQHQNIREENLAVELSPFKITHVTYQLKQSPIPKHTKRPQPTGRSIFRKADLQQGDGEEAPGEENSENEAQKTENPVT